MEWAAAIIDAVVGSLIDMIGAHATALILFVVTAALVGLTIRQVWNAVLRRTRYKDVFGG